MPRRPSLFLKGLYAGLLAKCRKFSGYVVSRAKSGEWHEIAHKFDWQRAELENIKKAQQNKLITLDRISNPVLDDLVRLSKSIDCIINELDVFISAIEHSAENVLSNKAAEEVETLDVNEVFVEQEAAWLLHRWIQTTEEMRQISAEMIAVEDRIYDLVTDQAMSKAMLHVEDKDAR
jgi:hypothetical protein